MPTPYDQSLMTLASSLGPVARAYRAAVDKVAAEYSLSQATGLPVLLMGRMGEGVRCGVLADLLGVEAPSLVRVTDQLVDSGLVERREDAHDRRAKTLHLTEEGKRRAAAMEEALVPFRRQLFAGVAEEDVQACLRVLHGLSAAIATHHACGRKAA
ncbi:MarR family transcriptional regulator [Massilia solisilvae]|uniref:MarR family transcriptional regulator n=1 Tax=Massilia solisilvae TaxID=1811225 RepID=A0ABT2BP92_9BURK|nr:MarR family transcriptional regulator [Massilia solisilvae]MCS0610330.1 MarR family transcriptional regulator [Massilia solisilvae]